MQVPSSHMSLLRPRHLRAMPSPHVTTAPSLACWSGLRQEYSEPHAPPPCTMRCPALRTALATLRSPSHRSVGRAGDPDDYEGDAATAPAPAGAPAAAPAAATGSTTSGWNTAWTGGDSWRRMPPVAVPAASGGEGLRWEQVFDADAESSLAAELEELMGPGAGAGAGAGAGTSTSTGLSGGGVSGTPRTTVGAAGSAASRPMPPSSVPSFDGLPPFTGHTAFAPRGSGVASPVDAAPPPAEVLRRIREAHRASKALVAVTAPGPIAPYGAASDPASAVHIR